MSKKNEQELPDNLYFGKKANAKILKLKAGESFIGTFKNRTSSDWIDKQTGKISDLVRLHFVDLDNNKVILFEDGGLKAAMNNAGVETGNLIKIVKLEKTALYGARTVNNYDIYIAENKEEKNNV